MSTAAPAIPVLTAPAFTMAVFAKFGYSLSHGASDQYYTATSVSLRGRQAGDLVFFRYLRRHQPRGHLFGGGQFIHASSSGGVKVNSLYESYYAPAIWGPDASSPEASHRDILREPPAGGSLTFSFASVYSVFLFIFAAFPLCNSLLSSVIFSPEASSLHDSLIFAVILFIFALDFYSSPLYHNHILRNTRSLPSTRPPAQAAQRIQSEV